MQKLLFVALGGALGAILRYLIAGGLQRWSGSSFPVGTLTVNLIGCLAIGFLGALFMGPWLVREEYRLVLLVGLLGSLTTFSTFGWETLMLAGDRQFSLALANLAISNGAGLFAVWIGLRVAHKVYGI
jgi:CrcB protein